MNYYLVGLLGLGCLFWVGYQIYVFLFINKLLDFGVVLEDIFLFYEFLFNKSLMVELYFSFVKGLIFFFILNWGEYVDFFIFKGGLNFVIGGLWLFDIVYYYLVLVVLFIVVGYMYWINWGIGYSMKEILEVYKDFFLIGGEGYKGLYEILIIFWYVQLVINLVMLGFISIIVVYYMYVMLLYFYIVIDYLIQLFLFIYYMWIGGFLIVGVGVYGVIFMVWDYDLVKNVNNVLD